MVRACCIKNREALGKVSRPTVFKWCLLAASGGLRIPWNSETACSYEGPVVMMLMMHCLLFAHCIVVFIDHQEERGWADFWRACACVLLISWVNKAAQGQEQNLQSTDVKH
jgi:hypothetical protein